MPSYLINSQDKFPSNPASRDQTDFPAFAVNYTEKLCKGLEKEAISMQIYFFSIVLSLKLIWTEFSCKFNSHSLIESSHLPPLLHKSETCFLSCLVDSKLTQTSWKDLYKCELKSIKNV